MCVRVRMCVCMYVRVCVCVFVYSLPCGDKYEFSTDLMETDFLMETSKLVP